MRKSWLLGSLILTAQPVLAHDVWMQPDHFILEEPGPVELSVFVGHGQDKGRWQVATDHIVKMDVHGPGGTTNELDNVDLTREGFGVQFAVDERGSYIVAMESRSSLSNLAADRFNDYVMKEGITPIARTRKAAGDEDTEGRERYSRRAKTIVQVGPLDEESIARVTEPINLSLEIVPERHPQALGRKNTMPVLVMFEGRPLAGALVKLTDLDSDAEPVATKLTDRSGRAKLRIPHTGSWQMNVIWSEPVQYPDAEFQTTFSSLAFQTVQ